MWKEAWKSPGVLWSRSRASRSPRWSPNGSAGRITERRRADKRTVSRFTEHAARLLEAAESASAHGESCSNMTILIANDGGIRMFADSDWPLDSLALHHGAEAAYRVSEERGSVRVAGRQGSRRCLLESARPSYLACVPAVLPASRLS